jgi:hypothetical protein
MMKEYSFVPGARFAKGVSAEVVGKALEEIQKEDGKVTAEALLKKAKAKKSPLHGLFEWDTDKAAQEYRLHQARNVIREVHVTIKKLPDQGPVRAFVHTKQSYQPIEAVASEVTRYEEAIAELKGKIDGLKQTITDLGAVAATQKPEKVAAITALNKAFTHVDKAVAQLN